MSDNAEVPEEPESEEVQLQRLSTPVIKKRTCVFDQKLSAEDETAVKNFITYLQFPTVHPDPDYTAAVSWLREQGQHLGLNCFIAEPVKNNPILVMCWQGSKPELPAILLNSHMDVVPVEEDWTHDPFLAEMTEDGNIYARGAQDMKCVGIQQLEAVRRLKASGFTPIRTVYLSFVPDEEMGGMKGMKPFTEGVIPSREQNCADEIRFEDMKIGFCLDEGYASPDCDFFAFYEERSPWWIRVTATGNSGHGSKFIQDTAFEKLHHFLTKITELRSSEKQRYEEIGKMLVLGSLVSLNVTVLSGGIQTNIVPGTMQAEVDIRLPPTINFEAFEKMLNQWITESGEGVTLEYIQKDLGSTGKGCCKYGVDPEDPWWNALKKVTRRAGVDCQIGIFPGATDARYLRRYHRVKAELEGAKVEAAIRAAAAANAEPPKLDDDGNPISSSPPPPIFIPAPPQPKSPIQAINFSPMRKTPNLLHDKDEFLNRKQFLFGVQVYTDLLREISIIDDLCEDEKKPKVD